MADSELAGYVCALIRQAVRWFVMRAVPDRVSQFTLMYSRTHGRDSQREGVRP